MKMKICYDIRSCHGNVMTPLRILLILVFLGNRTFSWKSPKRACTSLNCLNSPVSNLSRPLNRSTEDSFIQGYTWPKVNMFANSSQKKTCEELCQAPSCRYLWIFFFKFANCNLFTHKGKIGIWKCWLRRRGNRSIIPREKPLGARERTNNKLNPRLKSMPGFEPEPHR